MNLKRKNFIAIVTTVLLILAGCSSSNNDDNVDQSPQTDTAPGTLADQDNSSPASSVDLRIISNDILRSLAGYELELFGEEIGLIADRVEVSATSAISLPDSSVELTHRDMTQTFPVVNVQYDCAQGGSLTTSTLAVTVTVDEEFYNSVTDSVTYLFDQCQMNAISGPTVNGTMTVASRNVSQDGADTTEKTFNWEAFQWQQQSAEETINITASIRSFDDFNGSSTESRRADITEYTVSDSGVLTSGLQNARFLVSNIANEGGGFDFTVDTAGDVIDTSGTRITVLANPALNSRFVAPGPVSEGLESVPFNGRITFSASDGSMLDMVGNGANDSGTRLVDFTHTDTNGDVSMLMNQELIPLDVFLD